MTSLNPNTFFKNRVLWHVLFWIVATIYLAFAFRGRDNFFNYLHLSIAHLPGHVFFVYTMLYFLIPRYALQKRFFLFFTWLLVVVIICTVYARFIDTQVFHSTEKFTDKRLFLRSVFANFNICGIAAAIKFFKYWYTEREAKLEAEKVSLNAQLQLLKSQVHPHFLFNTLNNLYSLTLERSAQASAVVMKLSSLLRYMLYDCSDLKVSLENEIDALRNYVELEKIRYGNRLELSFNVSGDIAGKKIAPLLMLPLLENSFKHGASEQISTCWISFDLEVKENILYLKLNNSARQSSENKQGIGLQNLEKRLKLLYKDSYSFKTGRTDDTFTVSLELDLSIPYQSLQYYAV